MKKKIFYWWKWNDEIFYIENLQKIVNNENLENGKNDFGRRWGPIENEKKNAKYFFCRKNKNKN